MFLVRKGVRIKAITADELPRATFAKAFLTNVSHPTLSLSAGRSTTSASNLFESCYTAAQLYAGTLELGCCRPVSISASIMLTNSSRLVVEFPAEFLLALRGV